MTLPPSPEGGVVKTFPQVLCSAVTPIGTLSMKQDVTVRFIVPQSVAPNEEFEITFPGATRVFPSTSAGIGVANYSNVSQTLKVNNATFVQGSIVNPGVATLSGSPTTHDASFPTTTTYKSVTPGPFPPGDLTTPTISGRSKPPYPATSRSRRRCSR